VEIIRAAIYSTLFGKNQMEIVGNLQVALADVFENHQDSTIAVAGFWDSANGLSISLTNFIEFVVTPHIANLLIQNDLQITEDNANGHRLRSKDIGDAFQYSHENDDEDEVGVENLCLVVSILFYGRIRQKMQRHCLDISGKLLYVAPIADGIY
jgi:hypothetical protein